MIITLSVLSIGALGALGAFSWAAVRRQGAGRRWGSTCVLIISHFQTLGLLARLNLDWPPAVRELLINLFRRLT